MKSVAEYGYEVYRLLLVDDDELNLLALRKTLEQLSGAEFSNAVSGFQALELAEKQEYDVILLDVSMPGMDGFETAKRLKNTVKNSSTPIIFVTAICGNNKSELEGYESGGIDYITKPYDPQVLLSKVEQQAKRQQKSDTYKKELEQVSKEYLDIQLLLEAAKSILNVDNFSRSARAVFDAAKKSTGATAGYVALLSPDGSENEVLFLDAGKMPCFVDPELPMPIRGLRKQAYKSKHTVFDNDFSRSKWMKFMPKGHVHLDNVLFAPLTIEGRVEGIMGLANKPNNFTNEDAEMATALSDYVAIALKNSRNLDQLKESQRNLLLAQRQARMGSFVKDLLYGKTHFSEGMYAVLKIEPAATDDQDPLLGLPKPFRSKVEALWERACQSGSLVESELIFHAPDNTNRNLFFKVQPETDDHGNIIRLTGTCVDQTKQRLMMQNIFAGQRLESVGQLAGGIAHEINTPIQYISGNIVFIEELTKSFQDLYDSLATIVRDREDMNFLSDLMNNSSVGQLLSEAQPALADVQSGLAQVAEIVSALGKMVPTSREERGPVRINSIVRDVVTVSHREWQNIVRIETDLEPELPFVWGSASDLSQAILNLLMNAIHAVCKNEEKNNFECEKRVLIKTESLSDQVIISIIDTGLGIPDEIQNLIFDPFFSTKEEGNATGLGLCLSHFIIKGHDGRIEFNSEIGTGTTFVIKLPTYI